ncbi:MAG: hypothetical protein ACE5NG_03955 [bacterium]
MRKTISLFICVFVVTFFLIDCSNNDQAVGPEEVTQPQAKYDVATSTNQTQITLQITQPRFARSGYFEVKTEAERKEAEKLFHNSILGQNPKPPGEQRFQPKVESGGVQPLIPPPSEPEYRVWTKIRILDGSDLFHESSSRSTVIIDYIDVLHRFYRNG